MPFSNVYPQFIMRERPTDGAEQHGAVFSPCPGDPQRRRIESTHGNFQVYVDGVSPSVAKGPGRVDRERVTVRLPWSCVPGRYGVADPGL